MECSDPSEGTPCGFESHLGRFAVKAQLVEHLVGNEEAAGSTPVDGSWKGRFDSVNGTRRVGSESVRGAMIWHVTFRLMPI